MPLTREEFDAFLREGARPSLESVEAMRAQGTLTGVAGGYAVPQEVLDKIIERMDAHSAVRRVAERVPTARGGALPIPTVDDTDTVAEIVNENTVQSEDDIDFGQLEMGAWLYSSKAVRVSMGLLADGLQVEDRIARVFGRRIGRGQNSHFTTGTGPARPQGLVTGAQVTVTAASTTVPTFDELAGLVDSIDDDYLEGADGPEGESPTGVGWMMSLATRLVLRKIRDDSGGVGLGRPIWEPTTRRLLDFPVFINPAMPALGAGAKPIAFGNFNAGYLIRDVNEVAVQRLAERYSDYFQVGFIGHHRSDGAVQDQYAYAALKMAA